jgi:hypothetical protein
MIYREHSTKDQTLDYNFKVINLSKSLNTCKIMNSILCHTTFMTFRHSFLQKICLFAICCIMGKTYHYSIIGGVQIKLPLINSDDLRQKYLYPRSVSFNFIYKETLNVQLFSITVTNRATFNKAIIKFAP